MNFQRIHISWISSWRHLVSYNNNYFHINRESNKLTGWHKDRSAFFCWITAFKRHYTAPKRFELVSDLVTILNHPSNSFHQQLYLSHSLPPKGNLLALRCWHLNSEVPQSTRRTPSSNFLIKFKVNWIGAFLSSCGFLPLHFHFRFFSNALCVSTVRWFVQFLIHCGMVWDRVYGFCACCWTGTHCIVRSEEPRIQQKFEKTEKK